MPVTFSILSLSKCHRSVRILLSAAAVFVSCWPSSPPPPWSSGACWLCRWLCHRTRQHRDRSSRQQRAARGEWQMQTAAKGLNKDNSVQKHNSGKKWKPTSYERCQCMIFFHESTGFFF